MIDRDGGTHPVPEEARDAIADAVDRVNYPGEQHTTEAITDAVLAALAEAGYRVVRQEQIGVETFGEHRNPRVVPVWVDSEPSETP